MRGCAAPPRHYTGELRIGIHSSTRGGLVHAVTNALDVGAGCLQIFTSSPRAWRATRHDPAGVLEFRRARDKHGLAPLVVHTGYLINLAAAPGPLRDSSIQAFRGEVERALMVGAGYLVQHPGSAKGSPPEVAMERIIRGLIEATAGIRGSGLTLLLENTAGAGGAIGRTLEELAVLGQVAAPHLDFPLGYCLDTCHLYAAGYDIASSEGLARTVRRIGETLGLDRVPVIHSNDSKGALGSRLDRHANIGAGHIGAAGFRHIVNHPKLRNKAFILETPSEDDGHRRDVAALKSLAHRKQG